MAIKCAAVSAGCVCIVGCMALSTAFSAPGNPVAKRVAADFVSSQEAKVWHYAVQTMYTRFENNRFTDSLYLGTDPFTARLKTIDWEITLSDTALKGTPEKPLHLWVRKTGRLRNCPTENIVKGR